MNANRDGLRDRQILWAIPIAFAAHNLEEALGASWLAAHSALPALWRILWATETQALSTFYIALAGITSAVFLIAAVGNLADPRCRVARFLLLVQILMLVNAFWHLAAAIALAGYAPGVITAILLQLPLSWIALGRCWRNRWLARQAMIAAGVMVFCGHALLATWLLRLF